MGEAAPLGFDTAQSAYSTGVALNWRGGFRQAAPLGFDTVQGAYSTGVVRRGY